METYINFRKEHICLNNTSTTFIMKWWKTKKWKGTTVNIEAKVKLYLDKNDIWDLILFLINEEEQYLSFTIENLTDLALKLQEGEKVEFYFDEVWENL